MDRDVLLEDLLLERALHQLQETGWSAFSFQDLCLSTGLSLAEIHACYPTKEAILAAFFDKLDQEILEKACLDDLCSLKERLFELIFCRLECLGRYKRLVLDLYGTAFLDPCLAVFMGKHIKKTLLWMMDSAGCRSKNFSHVLFLNTFFSLYIVIFNKWLQDQTEDKAITLSFLDRSLERVFPLFQAFERGY